ncbi:MAG: hypothetical protein KatS3mg087_1243 [Patescibacteria group bacterium]|nr:MAG: hypothetical protein KatS3mg087_1243 [Patescibacteria group bacterium]
MYLPAVFAYVIGKLLWHTTRLVRIGGGSAAPGLIALKLNPNLLIDIRSQISGPCIVVAGTNGKTTTAALIRSSLAQEPKNTHILHNATGSNLSRGIVSAYIHNYQLFRTQKDYSAAVIEVDEAVLPQVLPVLRPTHLVLTNLFRDQLDRYGEIESIKHKWLLALQKLDSNCDLFINFADPQIAHLVSQLQSSHLQVHTYLLRDISADLPDPSQNILSPLEQGICPACNSLLTLRHSAIIGQGLFTCTTCRFHNSDAGYILTRDAHSDQLVTKNQQIFLKLRTRHKDAISLQNTLAAYAVLQELKSKITFEELTQNSPQKFGRFEKIPTPEGEIMLVLIKNPTGFTESLRSVTHQAYPFQSVAFILNDNLADGQDISWIWDAPLHKYLPQKLNTVYVSGSRALDMSLRLSYALPPESSPQIIPNLSELLQNLIRKKDSSIVFATYTAMLEIQSWLAENKIKNAYWK